MYSTGPTNSGHGAHAAAEERRKLRWKQLDGVDIPTRTGDRVKTDRKAAVKLARCYRAGELTAVWVPDAATEALRDLVRAREVAKQDQLRARHPLGKLLLRHGRQRP